MTKRKYDFEKNKIQYRELVYDADLNKDTPIIEGKYETYLGNGQKDNLRKMLLNRGGKILMVSVAGSGKTRTTMELMDELHKQDKEEGRKVLYALLVPTKNQSNQNELNYSDFNVVSIVGANEKGRKKYYNFDNGLYSVVYDKTLEIIEDYKNNGFEIVTIVDEAHKLISDAGFRSGAIAGIEDAMDLSDNVIMMTATARDVVNYYKFKEIYKFEDVKSESNIGKFRISFSDNREMALKREIDNFLARKTVKYVEEKNVVVECEPVEQLREDADLYDRANGTDKETVIYTREKKVKVEVEKPIKVVVRLNSKDKIDRFVKLYTDKGIECEVLTGDNKNGEVFKGIEERAIIESTAQLIFVTSVIECGISLINRDIVMIEFVDKASNFNSDNSIQFFARPRLKVAEGVLLLPCHTNKDLADNWKEYSKREDATMSELEFYSKNFKNISLSRKISDYNKDIEKYNLDLKRKEQQEDKHLKRLLNDAHYAANVKLNSANTLKDYHLANNEIERVRFNINYEIINDKYNNPNSNNCVVFDEDTLELRIDNKKVVYKASLEYDVELIKNPERLLRFFEGKIKYDEIVLECYNSRYEELLDEDKKKNNDEYKEAMKELKKQQREDNKIAVKNARDMFKCYEFTKILPHIYSGELHKENLHEYTLEYEWCEIKSFVDSDMYVFSRDLYKLYNDAEYVARAMTSVVHSNKHKSKLYTQLRKTTGLDNNDIDKNLNFVPMESEIAYTNIKDIKEGMELHTNINLRNKTGKILNVKEDKHSIITRMVKYEKSKSGRKQIRVSKDFLFMLNVELVYNGVYTDTEMSKAINAIKKEAKRLNVTPNLYAPVNRKKLEQVYSSNLEKRNVKMLNELSKVFNLTYDRELPKINGVIKQFDLVEYLNNMSC